MKDTLVSFVSSFIFISYKLYASIHHQANMFWDIQNIDKIMLKLGLVTYDTMHILIVFGNCYC